MSGIINIYETVSGIINIYETVSGRTMFELKKPFLIKLNYIQLCP